LRLFAVACARRVSHLCAGEPGPWASQRPGQRVETAERFADGVGSVEELEASREAGFNVRVIGAAPAPWRAEDYAEAAAGDACDSDASDAALWAMLHGQSAAAHRAEEDQAGALPEGTEHRPQVSLLRDIFGNPFRPVVFDPAWRTPSVGGVAQAIYT